MHEQSTAIRDFLKTQKLAVISTIHSDKTAPQSALIGFVETEDFTLYFQTQNHTRKARNLAANQHVALVIGTGLEAATTVQYEGVVQEVADASEKDDAKKRFIAKDSPSVRFFDNPATVMYKVTPTWIRYSNYSGKPIVSEVTDF